MTSANVEQTALVAKRRRWIAACALAAVVIAAVALIATSGQDSTGVSPAVTAPAAAQPQAQGAPSAQLDACFERNGVAPSEAQQHQGTPGPRLMKAFQACQKYLPEGSPSSHLPGGAAPAQP